MADRYAGIADISFDGGHSWIRVQATLRRHALADQLGGWGGVVIEIGAHHPWPTHGRCLIRVIRTGAPQAQANFRSMILTTSSGRRQQAELESDGEAPF